jgi:hypothetical protein
MKRLVGLFLLMFTAQLMLAKDDYPLTINVLSAQKVENKNGASTTANAKSGANTGADSSDKVAEHVMAEASDGNTYELAPENPKDILLPGVFQAKIEKVGIKVCEPKDKGKCREVKFKIVTAQQTIAPQQKDCTNEVVCRLLQINFRTKAAAK